MAYREKFSDRLFNFIAQIFLGLCLVVWLFPFVHVVVSSISRPLALLQGKVSFWPVGLDFTSYHVLLTNSAVVRSFLNSVFYSAGRGLLTLALLSPMAYALSHKELRGKGFFTGFILVTMLFSAGMIPRYIVVRALGLYDTRWAMVVPLLFSAYYVFLLRTNFSVVPEEIMESAYLDGANDWTVFARIVLPLSKPIISTIGLFAAVAGWNDFFSALLYLNNTKLWPLTVILRNFVMLATMPETFAFVDPTEGPGLIIQAKMTVIVVSVIPIVMVYGFIQKYFAKGIMVGAVKG
jgi:putative aldouronate transport system permease protein